MTVGRNIPPKDTATASGRLTGSIGRRGNPYDTAKTESLRKTLSVEGVHPLEFETAGDVMERLPIFTERSSGRRLHTSPGCLSPEQSDKPHGRLMVNRVA